MRCIKGAVLFILVACIISAQAATPATAGAATTATAGAATTANSTASSGANSTASAGANSTASPGGTGTFNINNYGASGDGATDSTAGILKAWTAACAAAGSTLVVGSGKYVVGPISFTGPCKGPITFQLDGTLLATTDLGGYKENWLEFIHVDGLTVKGAGTIDGQGSSTWPSNKCRSGGPCKCFPMSMVFAFTDNLLVTGIKSLNPKYFHFNIFSSKNVYISGVTITAPADSPNTDGIHMGDVSNVTIIDTSIGTGDDCVSIGAGTHDVLIKNVKCGPGHGLSLGSFGKYNGEKDVSGITVSGCTLSDTSNGLRIKTFQNNPSPLKASDIHFEDITMSNVANPIIVDQEYCPNGACSGGVSTVAISQVTFKNIKGTSSTPETVTLKCSKSVPCQGITLSQIQVAPTSGAPNVTCNNAQGTADGTLKDPCFK